MKVFSSTTAPLVLLSVLMAATHPLLARAHQEETSAIAAGASNLRHVTSNQEDRALAKGGNGGGGGGNGGGKKDDPTPQPTPQPTPGVTPATPMPTPPPVFQYPPVPTDSCGITRAPSSAAPTLVPTQSQCVNPSACNGKISCCDGYSCTKKTCVPNARQLRLRERKVAIEGEATDARQLNECTDNASQCNVYDNELLCDATLPSSRPESLICNYNLSGSYNATVTKCETDFCCEDGNGGYYFGETCWGFWPGNTCCPLGYTVIRGVNKCVPLNCCDGDATHRSYYCPSNCPGN